MSSTQSSYAANLLEVYNNAVRSDPISISAQLEVLDAKEQQQQAEAVLYPQASLSGSFSQNHLSGDDFDTQDYSGNSIRLGIDQVLFDLQAWRENEKYKLLIDESNSHYQQAQNDLIIKVVGLYFSVLEAQDALRLNKKNVETIGKDLEKLKALYDRQLVAVTGVYEAEARHDLAISAEIEAEVMLSVAFERLYEVIAERVTTVSPLKETLEFLVPEDSVEQWLSLAFENSPMLAASNKSVLVAKKEVSKNRAGFAPRFSLAMTQLHQDIGYDNTPRPTSDTSTISLNFSQPIYQGGGISAKKRQSVHRLGMARQAEIEAKRKIEQQLREHYLNVKSDVRKIEANKRLVSSEKKRSDSMRAGFRYGTVTVNDVLNADTAYLKAQLALQKAKYDYIINQIRLKGVAGLVAEKDIIELNNWVE